MKRSDPPASARRTPTLNNASARTLVVSFTTLVVTGLPLRYHDTAWAGWLFALMGGPGGRALLHRAAAVVMLLLAVYHVGYLLGSARGRYEVGQLIPKPQDLRDMLHQLLYYIGKRPAPPRYGRFSYAEKFEYLAVVWGTAVMAVTGLLLWHEVQAMAVLPKWMLDVAQIVHSYEALLAFAAIITSHFYNVHFRPGVFPMSRVFLDGRISESEMKHHHPLEYEEILRREQEATRRKGGNGKTQSRPLPRRAPEKEEAR